MKKTIALLLYLSTQSLHATNFLEEKIDAYLEQAQSDASVKEHWNILKQHNYVEHTGPDDVYRKQYVDLQGIIESALTDEKDINVTAIIHTATPPTPLRIDGDSLDEGRTITPGLLSDEVASHPELIATVTKRCNILRRFLANGKMLYAAYTQSALGIEIYNNLRERFKNLIDMPFKFEGDFTISELSGATYFIQIPEEQEPIVFSIRALQANVSQPNAKWVMWFGPLSNPQVNQRANQILKFLKEKNLPINLE